MTQRLYYADSYLTTFDAQVVAVDGKKVYLDRTAFYPTSGGQPFDTGTLGGARVIDVVDEEARIAHVLEATPAFAAGAAIEGRVDWERRFDLMRQHTGQHLLSAVLEDLFGHRTVSVHFGADYSTLDLDASGVTREQGAAAERRANEVVADNRSVTVTMEDAARAQGLRKAPDRAGEIRVVAIDGVDRSACGGTHVRATGELGAVLVRRLEKYKTLTRVEFLCGARAVRRARADYDALSAMAAPLSAGIDELPALVAAQAAAAKEGESARRKLTEALAAYRAREAYDTAAPGADGVRRIVHRAEALDDLRAFAHAFSALTKCVMVGICAPSATVMLAASADSGVKAGSVLKGALAAHEGRGGGNDRLAQGTAAPAALDAIVRELAGGS